MELPPWDYDFYLGEFEVEEKFDVREHFMLMPAQKRRIEAARARKEKRKERSCMLHGLIDDLDMISSLFPQLPQQTSSKKGSGTLERLDIDCLFHIMHQSRLAPDLWNLLSVSGKCRAIWETTNRSILVGMQEAKFSDYLAMFGKIGRQSDRQLHNLASALATDAWKIRGETYEPERSFMDVRKIDVRLYERSLILYLESTNDYFNDRVKMLHELDNFASPSHSRYVTKRAVLALWRMGWSRRVNREWWPVGSLGSSLMLDVVREILGQQPRRVRRRIRDILIHLANKIDKTSCISNDVMPWIEDRANWLRHRMRFPYDVVQWHQQAIRVTIVMEIVSRGIGGAIEYVTEIENGGNAVDLDHVRSLELLQRICDSRKTYDDRGVEDMYLRDLKNHVEVVQELGIEM